MQNKELTECHDCGVMPGEKHIEGCDTEMCSVCGEQYFICRCEGHDKGFARWTGLWPGIAEAKALGLDLNKFMAQYGRLFFIKPNNESR